MKSIIACLGSTEVPRLRVGVGRRPEQISLVDYVLGRFSSEDFKILAPSIDKALDVCKTWSLKSIGEAMNHIN